MLNLESVLLDAHCCLNEVIFAIYTCFFCQVIYMLLDKHKCLCLMSH
ncbi:unnamed protein product [Brassica rapa]|uniref:Uncharacterized protein n=1 Tax=Brassica campestris TaxID=3711 RepID=A0A3P5ZUY3_BRACM|nr:unnamed protein product [Brassica rapa]VDC76301.1 unnamed protein product [Brassica rapa]